MTKWLHLAAMPEFPYLDFALADKIADVMPKAIPEKGPGMWTVNLTEDEVRRILSFLPAD